MPTIFILNGPNLNLLGEREPEIYGSTTLDEIRQWCEADARDLGLDIDFRQSNFEGEIIEAIHAARKQAAGIIINPDGIRTIGEFPNLTAAMERHGWKESRIRKIMGENWVRVFKDVWGA